MKYPLAFLMIILCANFAFAQDPGERDSIIVETVFADTGDSAVDVRIYATTDDSVQYYNLPLGWDSPETSINPTEIIYNHPLVFWDILIDSIFYDSSLIRLEGWCDMAGPPNPPLITNNLRVNCWTLHFTVGPAPPQIIVIDTTYDPLNGSLIFRLGDGMTSFTPVFIPGAIYYSIASDVDGDRQIPVDFTLYHNYPNPFNASTTIEFTLPKETDVKLSVYNILGQKVAVLFDGQREAGKHAAVWEAWHIPSGVYFARLDSGNLSKIMKMILLK